MTKNKFNKLYEHKKCKNCDDGCVGCDYFHNKIIPKIEKLEKINGKELTNEKQCIRTISGTQTNYCS